MIHHLVDDESAALCVCGARSEELPRGHARRRWLRRHRTIVFNELVDATLAEFE